MRPLTALALASFAFAQSAGNNPLARGEQVLGWRVAADDSRDAGIGNVEITSRQLPAGASPQAVQELRTALQGRGLNALVYRVESPARSLSPAITTAAQLGAAVVVIPLGGALESLAKAAAEKDVILAIDATSGAMLEVEKALAAVRPYNKQVRLWVSPSAWETAGTRPLAAIYMLREYLAGASLAGQTNDEFVREAYRLDIKPLVWTAPPDGVKRIATTVEQLVAYHQSYASRTQGVRRLGGVSPEEREKLEAAIPATAPAKPKKARKLLVFDLNVGRFGHPSIPHANLAMQLMGKKTGAFEATVTSDPAMLQPARLKTFDAVYLNNTIGDIFSTAEARDAFAEFVRNGGGVMGNHATTVTMTEWPEFGEILGARGASHRMTDERVVINVEDPGNPIVSAFGGTPFEYEDEIFRFQPPYSRDKVRVLLSVDPIRTNMNQGRCYGQCYRDDNDYPIAWIRQYGQGRVFYTTLGHNPHVFWQPNMLRMFLAAAQYILGDLEVDATPRPQVSVLDGVLPQVVKYDWGHDEAPVRQLDRAMGLLTPGTQAARAAEEKLLTTLKKATTLGAKDALTRQLAIVGSQASVPALAPMLSEKATADMARYALERIEGAEAVTALRNALNRAPDSRSKNGIIHSLARRKDAASVSALRKLMEDSDANVAASAVNALGIIATREAEEALTQAKLTPGIADALLTMAEQAPRTRALGIYKKLADQQNPDTLRVAAIHGLARVEAKDAVAQAIEDPSPNVQAAALSHLPVPALLAAMEKLQPAMQIQALAAAAQRGDPSARPAFHAALKSDVPQVRLGALQGFETLASSEDVAALTAIAAKGAGDEQAAARMALSRAPGIDGAIAAAIPTTQGKEKVELIRAVGERGNRAASSAVLASISDTNPSVRREALRALRGIAQPEQSVALLRMLIDSEDDRDELQRALAASIGRSDKPSIQPVVEAFDNSQDSDTRASLLGVIALTGGNDALPVLRKALGIKDAAIQRAAISGLSEWTSPDPMNDLIEVARSSPDPALKALALRGYIRLVQRPVGRPAGETAKLLAEAMSAASRPEDKKAVLAAVQRVVSPESLAIAQAAAGDPAVAAEANLAVTTIQGALAARGRQ